MLLRDKRCMAQKMSTRGNSEAKLKPDKPVASMAALTAIAIAVPTMGPSSALFISLPDLMFVRS